MTFEDIEDEFVCVSDSDLKISISKNEDGPWTLLEDQDELYTLPILVLLQRFQNYNYFQLRYFKAVKRS